MGVGVVCGWMGRCVWVGPCGVKSGGGDGGGGGGGGANVGVGVGVRCGWDVGVSGV